VRVLVDTNFLLRWSQASHPQNALCQAALRRLSDHGAELFFTFQNIAELWNVATRPLDRNGFGLTPQEVEQDVRSIEVLLSLLPDSPTSYAEWRGIVSTLQVSGVQAHDARLAAAMVVHDLTHLLTFNKADFARYTGITALDPSDVLAQYPSTS
jgi:predicted nucleic acid-binding protein